ncbi:MAG: Endolytic murein transglycosylase [Campylobacterota bacterium]|nr:Endolytic murein transglycosylase [Campylobacterota bacterium]
MKQIISHKYRRFVIYFKIFMAVILLPLVYNFIPINHTTTTFYLPASDFETVKKTLKKNGYDVTWIDALMLKLIRVPMKGWYEVDPKEHGRLLFYEYLHRKRARTMQVVIYAGETKEELVKRLANDMKLDEEKLMRYYKKYARFEEGDILAHRYTIARSANEKTTMEYLFRRSSQMLELFKKEHLQEADASKLQQTRIIASIIQKESSSADEMPAISSVIHNRLKKNMRLQMDGTLNYGPHSHTIITPERIKTDKSPFNTYKHRGLPPYALGTISLEALTAAVYPTNSDYLFFMLNKDGTHNFTQTYEEHRKNIKIFRAYLNEKKAQEGNTTLQPNNSEQRLTSQ